MQNAFTITVKTQPIESLIIYPSTRQILDALFMYFFFLSKKLKPLDFPKFKSKNAKCDCLVIQNNLDILLEVIMYYSYQ